MSVTRVHGEGVTSRGPTLAEADMELSVEPRDRLVSPSLSDTIIVDDAVVDVHTPAEVDREADLRVTLAGLLHVGTERVTYRNLTPEIASIDEATGQLTRVADGTARIVVGTRYIKKLVEAEMLRESGQTVQVFDSWVEGSLAAACTAAIDDRINGLTGDATTMLIRDAGGYNADGWMADLDLSCVSNQIPRGTLISPRHLLGAEHHRPGGTSPSQRRTARSSPALSSTART